MKAKNNTQSIDIALRERVKELKCLYDISELAQRDDLNLNEILDSIIRLIPQAWQYPDYTIARIILDDNDIITGEYQALSFRQSEKIYINGKHRGYIEVYYIKSMPDADEGPFLHEERKLIQAIARKLSLIIERKEALVEKQNLYEQIRHADRLKTIGEFTAGIAHEINEPLGTILGFSQLALKNNNLTSVVKQDLEKILKAALHAREVIKKLMYFSHQMPQNFVNVNMNRVIKDVMYIHESLCAKENIHVSYNLSKKLPDVYADPIQMNQVVVNIVVNAIQAMTGGGKLELSTNYDDDNVHIVIKDNGIGISEKTKQDIFKPFFTTKKINEGTGLGLSVVHGIVSTHHGAIEVDSELGKGTTFAIKFPLVIQRHENTK